MDGSCEYVKSSHRQPTTGDRPAGGLGVGLTTSHLKKISSLHSVTKGLRRERILWINDLN
jgi:hypothetical protein